MKADGTFSNLYVRRLSIPMDPWQAAACICRLFIECFQHPMPHRLRQKSVRRRSWPWKRHHAAPASTQLSPGARHSARVSRCCCESMSGAAATMRWQCCGCVPCAALRLSLRLRAVPPFCTARAHARRTAGAAVHRWCAALIWRRPCCLCAKVCVALHGATYWRSGSSRSGGLPNKTASCWLSMRARTLQTRRKVFNAHKRTPKPL